MPEADSKEKLAWEKELLGVYLSEHPLQRAALKLAGTVTALCGEIDQEMANQKVIVAGMISALRRIITKKGDPMAFVTLEDVQGSIEVTVFPRTFKETEELWEMERIVVVRGRVDVREEKVSIICDQVQAYVESAGDESVSPNASGSGDVWMEAPPPDFENGGSGNGYGHNGNGHNRPREQQARPASGIGKRKRADGAPLRHHLRIVLPYSDEEAGIKRLREVHQALARYPGEDRISLWLQSALSRVKLSTTMTTHYCQGLAADLESILGEGTVTVEQI